VQIMRARPMYPGKKEKKGEDLNKKGEINLTPPARVVSGK